MSKGIQIAIGAGIIALLLGWYGLTNTNRFQYFKNVAEFQKGGEPGDKARVHGYVVPDSINRDLETKSVAFAIQSESPMKAPAGSETLAVRYDSLETPDMFQDGAEVVVEGFLGDENAFEASKVLAKCPSKFEASDTKPAPF